MWCGVCDGCKAKDCGSCCYCLDMPKYGGKRILKQSCIMKRCKRIKVQAGMYDNHKPIQFNAVLFL